MIIISTYRWASVAVVMSGTTSRYLWRLFNLLVKQIVVVGVVVVPVVCPQCRSSSRGGSLRNVSRSRSRRGCGGSRTSSPTHDRNAPCATCGCRCGCGQSVQKLLEPNVKLGVEGFLESIDLVHGVGELGVKLPEARIHVFSATDQERGEVGM